MEIDMPDLNKVRNDVSVIRKKAINDLGEMHRLYTELEHDIGHKFREEYQNNNRSMKGLEDFHMLHLMCKKNLMAVKNAHSLISRMKDISKFDISEEAEAEQEISEILKD